MLAVLLLLGVYALALGLCFSLREEKIRRLFSRALAPAALALLLPTGAWFSPVERLMLSTAGMIALIKCAAALLRPRDELRAFSRLGLALYFWIWPGVDMAPFRRARGQGQASADGGRSLFRGAACLVAGSSLLATLAWFAPRLDRAFAGWATIGALLLVVHFGLGQMLPWAVRVAGFAVGDLFRAPLLSASLSDFWSRRWNLAFVEMDRILFLRPLRRSFGPRGALLGVFVLSGIFHEMGISYPSGAGWGGPMLFFVGHGLLVSLVEPRLQNPLARRAVAWAALLLPLGLLFHAPFRQTLVLPLLDWLSGLLHARPFDWYLHLALWLGSIGHGCILAASFQVPARLGWKQDFASLSAFNRKIFWTYGAFIVLCIVSFGVLSAALHFEMARGEKSAVAISLFIGLFWLARVLTDLFYFAPSDWPRGWLFEAGHAALTFVFVCLTILFGVVVPWHSWWLRG